MNVIVNGALGVMGQHVVKLINENSQEYKLFALVDKNANGQEGYFSDIEEVEGQADVIIDFSSHFATKSLCDYAVRTKTPLLIATTGHNEEELNYIKESSKDVQMFISGNVSVGISLLAELARQAVATFPDADVEIIETHHNRKVDAPSGTALLLANAIKEVRTDAEFSMGRSGFAPRKKNEIGIHAIRRGNVVGIHDIIISTNSQTITLGHQAHDRALFAEGALVAGKWLCDQNNGLYNMKDMLK